MPNADLPPLFCFFDSADSHNIRCHLSAQYVLHPQQDSRFKKQLCCVLADLLQDFIRRFVRPICVLHRIPLVLHVRQEMVEEMMLGQIAFEREHQRDVLVVKPETLLPQDMCTLNPQWLGSLRFSCFAHSPNRSLHFHLGSTSDNKLHDKNNDNENDNNNDITITNNDGCC